MNGDAILVSRREAAERLGMSLASFERHVQPEVKLVRRGRMRLVRVTTLERWAAANEAHTLEANR